MQEYSPRPREQAEELIKAYIIEHNMKVYDALPPEREMCEMWGLNRVTLRSAISLMVKNGLLYSIQGSGTRIAPRFVRTLQDLQGFSEYAVSSGFSPSTQFLSFSTIECDKHLSNKFKLCLGEKIYKISRLRSLNQKPVLIETAYIPYYLAPGLEEQDLVSGSLFSILKNNYGLVLEHGMEKASITYATEEEANFLGVENGSPLYWIVSTTNSTDDTTIEYCRSVARPDFIEMASTLTWSQSNDSRQK